MRALFFLLATIALLACEPAPQRSRDRHDGPRAAKVEGLPVKTGSEPNPSADECLDRWLAEQKLDAFGSPLGTVYAGGTPILDETTGTARSRWDYLVEKYPGLARTCDGAHGPPR